jgi:hypothetical protein
MLLVYIRVKLAISIFSTARCVLGHVRFSVAAAGGEVDRYVTGQRADVPEFAQRAVAGTAPSAMG